MKKVLAALGTGLALYSASALAWPEKTVNLIVPFPPGGSTDQVGRAISQPLTDAMKQSFVVDNRAGATGTIGAALVSRAAPDGYTFLVTSLGPLVIVPHLMKTGLPYDPLKDFDPITVAVTSPNVLVVPTASPHRSVADIIAFQKANPGRMTFASAGSGSSDHMTAELFWIRTQTQGIHVPYKGGGPAHTDLMGGQVDASFQNINSIIQYVKAGKMRPLAITSEKRSPLLPDVPTLAEAGVKDLVVTSWQGVVAPKGLPADVKKKAHAAIVDAIRSPKVSEQFSSIGFEIVANSPEAFAAFLKQDSDRWKEVAEKANIKLQ